ncbi:1-deoxy-D-xylulose-5-phosphate synthase [Nocardia transvalensis]|uniref:1-deoxy-D-xylulose-5-phosphate synthase n=1 Tax=Nocardia transvalensis TaxID=37333 RepID=A0A7W9ULJ1_9NOCA|nr:1-deoxy-D-xylulose-5-phosphate synthase [Nocardia transvalensis]MBB5917417.1 1-deoxy-D-xylulose-5-phosphate synthase [Nocardia transvalensis]
MQLLNTIGAPGDLAGLSPGELRVLAAEIRAFLVENVCRTGGHLGPNLGVVELTLALHRVFDSPSDRILWDTGHQTYVHKMLTGRRDGFDRLRSQGGLSGYPAREESEHDVIENSHASTALAYADGLAKGYRLQGISDRAVVVVVGDGALTGGMAWEALNSIAAARDRPVVIVVNDNGRSYSPTVGGLADRLAALRVSRRYEQVLAWGKRRFRDTPLVYGVLYGIKQGLKEMLAPQNMFEDLGLKYVGPIDGHDVAAMESALRRARDLGMPVLVHCLTRKGKGYAPAEEDVADCFHAVKAMDPRTGKPVAASGRSWTSEFSAELVALAQERPDLVGITAAMLGPTGLAALAQAHPERVFDVGIAEQHAVTSAAGLALSGLHPVVAIYSTFLTRAVDQVLMDVALHRCGVTFVLDRAGVTGDDGASHNGVWDLALFRVVPGLTIAAPRDGATLRRTLREAVAISDHPTLVRFPKGAVGEDIPVVATDGPVEVLRAGSAPDVLIVAVGPMASLCLRVADRLGERGIGAAVVDPVWVQPVAPELVALACRHRLVVTVEDGLRDGGVGTALAEAVRAAGGRPATMNFGVPRRFLRHGTRSEVLADCGLTDGDVAAAVLRAAGPPGHGVNGDGRHDNGVAGLVPAAHDRTEERVR